MSALTPIVKRLAEALDRCAIPYFVCGSVASGIHGIHRTAFNVDLVADLTDQRRDDLTREFNGAFRALSGGPPFHYVHYASSYMLHIFPLVDDPYQRTEFSRRVLTDFVLDGVTASLPLATAEDTLLTKLAWYRAGGEVSERQWNDVLGIVAVQGERLDRAYLTQWAAYLKVTDLLQEVLP